MLHVYVADKGSEKKKLFEGSTSDTKPKMRTAAEIKAKYRETGVITISLILQKKIKKNAIVV